MSICKMVKSYRKEKSVPILATHIVRNHYRDDIVGCKIVVLQDDKNKCLSDDIWPDGVKLENGWLKDKIKVIVRQQMKIRMSGIT